MKLEMQMIADEVACALNGSGKPDKYFVEILGVHQSTVSRLRAKKIAKTGKYRDSLEKHGLLMPLGHGVVAVELQALSDAASEQPALRQLISSLHQFVHNYMQES